MMTPVTIDIIRNYENKLLHKVDKKAEIMRKKAQLWYLTNIIFFILTQEVEMGSIFFMESQHFYVHPCAYHIVFLATC